MDNPGDLTITMRAPSLLEVSFSSCLVAFNHGGERIITVDHKGAVTVLGVPQPCLVTEIGAWKCPPKA